MAGFRQGTQKTAFGGCMVCGKTLPQEKYVYHIQKSKVTRSRTPYGELSTLGFAHIQCLLKKLDSQEALMEILRLEAEGKSGNS